MRHLPGYIENMTEIRGKGVDLVVVIATNDPFVMSAWGKVNGITDEILFLSDPDAKFAKSIGWDMGVSPNRTARFAVVVDNGVVRYAEKEPGRDVTVCYHLSFDLFVGRLEIFVRLCFAFSYDFVFLLFEHADRNSSK